MPHTGSSGANSPNGTTLTLYQLQAPSVLLPWQRYQVSSADTVNGTWLLPHNVLGLLVTSCAAAPVTCINNNGNIALSGCDAGVLKLWRMADGQLADSVPLYDDAPAAVIAISCLGPLLVAAGNSAGAVTLYDIASGRLLAVQRLQAGEGPISCLTSWLDTELLKDAVLAAPGPRIPDGGGVLPGPDVGIPWRKKQQQQSDLQGLL
eukprot:GHUV01021609.1.p1 GENE.GHUV01021609.1~~GHUV01021609.1.p1  ORF type:complete len:206 (+),score=68.62 GHUV01021609.1:1198-1815(+)